MKAAELRVRFERAGKTYEADLNAGVDLTIPQTFGLEQPNVFGAPKALKFPLAMGGYVGEVRQGGSTNCHTFQITPHCNGTHTECAGHILNELVQIGDVLGPRAFFPALLMSILPERGAEISETYSPGVGAKDLVLTRAELKNHWPEGERFPALIIRTLPNTAEKRTRVYSDEIPPYFTNEAMRFIREEKKVEHLLVDTPSVDRLWDEGRLSNHHIFWGIPADQRTLYGGEPPEQTITELIFAPDAAPDGFYLVGIHPQLWAADAAPSRVVLYKPEQIG